MASGVNDIKDYYFFFPFLVFFSSLFILLILSPWLALGTKGTTPGCCHEATTKKECIKKSQGNLGAGRGRVWLQTWRGRCSAAATRI